MALLPLVGVCLPHILNSNSSPNPVRGLILQCCRTSRYHRILRHKGSGRRCGQRLVRGARVGNVEKAVAVRPQVSDLDQLMKFEKYTDGRYASPSSGWFALPSTRCTIIASCVTGVDTPVGVLGRFRLSVELNGRCCRRQACTRTTVPA